MKHLAITLLLAGTVFGLAACAGSTDNSGASYAKERTAGDKPGTEYMFKKKMYK
jgi:hypothetical protein